MTSNAASSSSKLLTVRGPNRVANTEFSLGAGTLNHPCDSPSIRAFAGSIDIERPERVAAWRKQLEVVGRTQISRVGRNPGRLAAR